MTKRQRRNATGHTPLEAMARANGNLFGGCIQASQALLENTFAVNQEMMRFAGERFQTDVEALQSLAQCKSWQDVADLQTDFARSAAEAYQAEISELVNRGTALSTCLWEPFREFVEASSEEATQK